MTNEPVMVALAASEPFRVLAAGERDTLAAECHVRRYPSEQLIFARGDKGATMYLVAQGSVALTVTSPDGGEVMFAALRPPQTFGELSLIDDGPRIATATTREPTTLVGIPRDPVLRLIHTNPAFAIDMLSALARLIRRVDDHLADMTLLDLRGRVVKFLAAAADGGGTSPSGSPVAVEIKLTQTELARLLGGSRQQINRIIVDLERHGAIHRTGTRITTIRPDLLRTGADSGGRGSHSRS